MSSKFLLVKCKCGEEQKIFSNASSRLHCNKCSELVAEPSGGVAAIHGKIVKEFG